MKKSQKGFAAIEALLIVVIVGMLSGVGWYVWYANNQANKNLDSANNVSQNTPTAKKKTATTQQKDFVIKEWGVQGKYAESINLMYKVEPSTTAPQTAAFTSTELSNSTDKTCSEEDSAGGVISRYKSTEHYLVGDSGEDSGQSAATFAATLKSDEYAHVGDYYYFYTGIQGVCSSDKTNQDLQAATTKAVQSLLATLTATPSH